LYACSPRWEKDYIGESTLNDIIYKIEELRCHSVHIGGGEPFLNPVKLETVMRFLYQSNITVEYIETNASWFRDVTSACALLESLKSAGLSTLLVSISPFHNEHIPFYKTKGVIEACALSGLQVFPWVQDFYSDLARFDDKKVHSLTEYEKEFGKHYLKSIPSRYWIHFGGRALSFFKPFQAHNPFREIVDANPSGCCELMDVSHFHFDLYGNYIPGLCSGLSIQLEDLGVPLNPEKYPFLTALFQRGISGLLDMAMQDYGFQPEAEYVSKCELCQDIRKYLILNQNVSSRELQPVEFYRNL
jgi:hypothetical protein